MGEVAMGVVLLIGAGLLIRSLANLSGLKPGFDPSHVIAADLSLQDARYATSQQVNELFDKTLARIEDLPGVESAAVVLRLPYQRLLNLGFRWLDGPNKDKPAAVTNLSYITPRYFETLRIPLLRGRAFAALDRANSQAVVIVNEAFVHRYLQGQAAIGSHIGVSNASREIVGVVGDTQQRSGWGNYGPIAPMPTAYIPATQTNAGFLAVVHTWFSPSWVVRTSGPVQGLLAGMQRAVESVDPQLPFASFRTLDAVRSESLAEQRLLTTLLSVLAGLALLLAAVGIYGLIANSVVDRTRELGIRMALGATPGQAMQAVLAQGLVLSAVGVLAGCIAAKGTTQLLRHMLFGVSATDPLTFAGVALLLLLIATLAGAIPARRILNLDPAETLRHE
jgi:predicted permease